MESVHLVNSVAPAMKVRREGKKAMWKRRGAGGVAQDRRTYMSLERPVRLAGEVARRAEAEVKARREAGEYPSFVQVPVGYKNSNRLGEE